MRYVVMAEAYRDLERVSSRLALTERLAVLLAQTPADLLPTVCYLCQGLIAPEFAGFDLGLAEKLAVRALGTAVGADPAQVAGLVRETGDLGQAAEQLLELAGGRAASLEVAEVIRTLREIAVAEGPGSQGRKLELLGGLLARATPLEARYLLRLVTRNLRLGIGTPTILDALVYADGQDLTMLPYPRRRAALEAAVTLSPRLRLTTAAEVADPATLDALFAQAITDGCEGLVCKSTGPDSGMFRAVTKCGAGFSDADLAALPVRLAPLLSPNQPARVDARQEPDVWFEPGLVIEVLSAELTLSPNYTAAWGQIAGDAGLAMRFPRFTGRWRDDKSPEDATTTRELAELFLNAQRTPTGG